MQFLVARKIILNKKSRDVLFFKVHASSMRYRLVGISVEGTCVAVYSRYVEEKCAS